MSTDVLAALTTPAVALPIPLLLPLAQAEPITPAAYVFNGVLLLIGLAVGAGLGVFRRDSVNGPERLEPARPAWPLVIVFVVGLFAWLGVQFLFGIVKQAQRQAAGEVGAFTVADLTPAEFAFLSTVPPLAGLVALLVGDGFLKRAIGARLGLDRSRVLPGMVKGVLGTVVLMPIILFASVAIEHVYQLVGYEHPTEHELLTVLAEAHQPVAYALLVLGATVMAPLFEEVLFRGHLQTLVRRVFGNRARRVVEEPPMDAGPTVPVEASVAMGEQDGAPSQTAVMTVPYAAPAIVRYELPPPDAAWQRWAAVGVTSALFALVHAAWSAPPIFILSLGLGYAYERTGNLWVPITMHLLFNSIQTLFFLNLR